MFRINFMFYFILFQQSYYVVLAGLNFTQLLWCPSTSLLPLHPHPQDFLALLSLGDTGWLQSRVSLLS